MKRKVLYVAHGHPAFSPGGGELAAAHLHQAMKATAGYEPHLLARVDDADGRFRHSGAPLIGYQRDDSTHLIASNSGHYDYFFHTKIDSRLAEADMFASFREFLLALQPDVVHFQHFIHLGADLMCYARSLLPHAKIVLTLHEYEAICANQGLMLTTDGRRCRRASTLECCRCFPHRKPREFFLRERLIKSNFAVVDRFIAPSHFLKTRYVEWGIAPGRILVMDNGRPVWRGRERPPRRLGQLFRPAFFGQVVAHKGCDVFLRAAEEYLQSQSRPGRELPQVRFGLYGARHWMSGSPAEELDRLIERTRGVVHHHGAYDMDCMPDLLSGVDCVVLPSLWWENSPLVIQEAFMAGLPVVCSNIGGMAEKVTDGVNGLHFAVGDHFDLLRRILELAASPELYGRLVTGIPGILSAGEMAGRITTLYDELLEGNPAS